MAKETITTPIANIFGSDSKQILDQWVEYQLHDKNRNESISEASIRNSSTEFMKSFASAIRGGNLTNLESSEWSDVLSMLSDLSASRALQGSSPTETASFVFSLKQVLFDRLSAEFKPGDPELTKAIWEVSSLIDKLGMFTTEVFQKSRESIIRRQQKDIMEMSTPVIKIWDGVLSVPLIGTLDSARTQIVMEGLLQKIVETNAKVAILDITGVPTVDTQTAQQLMKTVSAARLMGAECIVSGIRPQIAQTIVHLGIEISDISTKASMADALREALTRQGFRIERDEHAEQ